MVHDSSQPLLLWNVLWSSLRQSVLIKNSKGESSQPGSDAARNPAAQLERTPSLCSAAPVSGFGAGRHFQAMAEHNKAVLLPRASLQITGLLLELLPASLRCESSPPPTELEIELKLSHLRSPHRKGTPPCILGAWLRGRAGRCEQLDKHGDWYTAHVTAAVPRSIPSGESNHLSSHLVFCPIWKGTVPRRIAPPPQWVVLGDAF